ncbi:MAG: hypothetical protein IM638_05605 [Bacteroidetes bacterium]|nr:hypothetical protein [Bacteroidota bacterium]
MNHDEPHILPPDADDLSVHAPLLHSLQHTEGLAVPEGYFDTLVDDILAQVNLPALDGFTAQPEGYESELTDKLLSLAALPEPGSFVMPEGFDEEFSSRIAAFTALPAGSGLDVPEAYFDELTLQIDAQLQLPSGSDAFADVPEGYFNEFTDALPAMLALDNVKQDEGFALPPHYFGELTEAVMQRTSAEILAAGSDADVPPGYFEALPERILAQTESDRGGKVIALTIFSARNIAAVAASVALLVGAAWWFTATANNEGQQATGLASHKPLPLPRFETAKPAPEEIQVAEKPVYKAPRKANQTPEKMQPEQQSNTAVAVEFDLIDEYALADYAAEQFKQTQVSPDAEKDAELRYYLENTELGEILEPID